MSPKILHLRDSCVRPIVAWTSHKSSRDEWKISHANIFRECIRRMQLSCLCSSVGIAVAVRGCVLLTVLNSLRGYLDKLGKNGTRGTFFGFILQTIPVEISSRSDSFCVFGSLLDWPVRLLCEIIKNVCLLELDMGFFFWKKGQYEDWYCKGWEAKVRWIGTDLGCIRNARKCEKLKILILKTKNNLEEEVG